MTSKPARRACDVCGKEQQPVFDDRPDVFDSGISMPFRALGYYGGFVDNEPWEELKDDEVWRWCHDCIVGFLRSYPQLACRLSQGQHPCTDDVPCCEWAWTWNEDRQTVLAVRDKDGSLRWETKVSIMDSREENT